MKVACMQPYFLPYIGYWQLINHVDTFVVLDNVQYISRGWINRNYLSVNGCPFLFTIPLSKASINKPINEIKLQLTEKFKSKLSKTIKHSYNKSEFYSDGIMIWDDIMSSNIDGLSEFLMYSIKGVCEVLGITTNILLASDVNDSSQYKGVERILNICEFLGAKSYINPIGGVDLYNNDRFKAKSVDLSFLKTNYTDSRDLTSIIDQLLKRGVVSCMGMLSEYTIRKKNEV